MNFDSLSIGEVIELEDMAGIPLAQIGDDKPVGRVLRALVYIMMKRSGREMSPSLRRNPSLHLSRRRPPLCEGACTRHGGPRGRRCVRPAKI